MCEAYWQCREQRRLDLTTAQPWGIRPGPLQHCDFAECDFDGVEFPGVKFPGIDTRGIELPTTARRVTNIADAARRALATAPDRPDGERLFLTHYRRAHDTRLPSDAETWLDIGAIPVDARPLVERWFPP